MKKNGITQRIASLALAVIMLLSCIPSTAWAVDTNTDIKAIDRPAGLVIAENYDDYFGDNWLKKLELPQFVTITLANNTTSPAPVVWDTSKLDTRTPGYYFLPGTVSLPAGATNGGDLSVSITIQVCEVTNLLSNPSFEGNYSSWNPRYWRAPQISSLGYAHGMRTPAAVGNYALGIASSTSSLISYAMLETDNSHSTALAAKVKELGAGQYYLSAQVRDYDETIGGNVTEGTNSGPFSATVSLYHNATAAASGETLVGESTPVAISKEEYVTIGSVVELDGTDAWIRPKLNLKSNAAFSAEYILVDDMQFLPLKVALKAEPANIAVVNTKIAARAIAKNYDTYVGENWKETLGLPKTVEVVTDKGSTASVDVTWDFSDVDFTKLGKQTITGTLESSAFPNPKGLVVQQNIYIREMTNLFTNPSFEGNYTGWHANYWQAPANSAAGYSIGMRGPAAVGNYAFAVASHATANTSYGIFRTKEGTYEADLAAKVKELGAGQYYLSAQARDYDETAGGNVTEGTNSGPFSVSLSLYKNSTFTKVGDTTAAAISKDAYATTSGVFELDGTETLFRVILNLKSSTAFTKEYILADDMQFLAINIILKEEPANIAEVKTEIQSRFVTLNYDQYVGANWQNLMNLPKTVEVVTDKGSTASVDVTWDFSDVDFTKLGKQTITGTLDSSMFPNPDNLVVKQNIYVRKAENLFSTPSFEEGNGFWKGRWYHATMRTPAADGNFALGLLSNHTMSVYSYAMMETQDDESIALAAKVAELGAGQYYISAQARDYDETNIAKYPETTHSAPLSVTVSLYKNSAAQGGGETLAGESAAVTIAPKAYVTTGGVFELDGTDAWLRPKLNLKSSTPFTCQWILADDMQFIPLNVLIPKGAEPSEVVEVIDEIPQRLVVQNYDQYAGSNWQEAIGLPDKVKVKTSKGQEASVEVIWDYTPLNLKKVGKYTLIGTLDDSLYPNPEELFVTQTIYIREAKNLFRNPSFESGSTYWSPGYDAEKSVTPAAVGHVALAVQSNAKMSVASYRLFETAQDESMTLASKIADLGAGQYYLSAQVRDFAKSGETPHSNPLSVSVALYHSTVADMYTEKIKGESVSVTISSDRYVTTSGIFELDGKDAWVRPKLFLKSNSNFTGQWVLADDMQLIPLNVIVQKYEGEMQGIETIIPSRKIIKDYPSYIGAGYTDADLLLPETVQVRSTMGELVNVEVEWNLEKLDLSKVGTYKLIGRLEDMKLDNPKSLTVEQTIYVVKYTNLLSNPSFEDDLDNWYASERASVRTGITSPVKDGSFSIRYTVGQLDGYSHNWLQAFQGRAPALLGEKVTQTGSGRYYFGCWAQGTASSLDFEVAPRLWYKSIANGSSLLSQIAPGTTLSSSAFTKHGDFVDLPGDVSWARLDIYFNGSPSAMRQSMLYLDLLELIPLNVEVPNLNDVMACEKVADIYVHEGSSIANLKLPKTLEIQLKNSQKFNVSVTWNTSAFNPNKIGEQTITGTLELGNKYKNSMGFSPTVKIIVREKGEDLRQTIYISASGSEANDGLSPEKPKQDIKNIPNYLAQGYNVKLKRGDIWYLPSHGFTFNDIHGTEDAPLVVGAYGSADALPIICFMLKIQDAAWELVDVKRNIYAADVSSLGTKNGIHVHRCFVNDEAYLHKNRNNYVALDAGEYCSYGGKLYIRTEGVAPTNVEVTPYGSGGYRMVIENVSHLTFEYIHIKGSSAMNNLIRMNAPTAYVKFQYLSITHNFYYTITMDSEDDQIHYKPEISHCYIDSMLSEEEGYVVDGHWAHSRIEGITMRDGVDGAWIHDNHIRNMSHAFVAIETLDTATEPKITGVRNCIIEDNVFEGANAAYARAFSFCGGFNQVGSQMCRDNIFRRNKCYDMSTSSHLFGENNLVYSNIFSYTHCVFDEDGELLEGKNPQPWGIDVYTYNEMNCIGTIIANNTFYDVSGAVAMYDLNDTVYDNVIANNLVVNWTSDAKTVYGIAGAIYDNTSGLQYVMNNGVYSTTGRIDHFVVDNESFLAEDVNSGKPGYSNNLSGDPKFVNADLALTGKNVRHDFALSGESPFRYAGLSINAGVYKNARAWEKMKADYTDLNGVAFLAESPSIGAISYSEKIRGEVASVDELEDIVVRTGATYESLPLPDTVRAVNNQGVDVILLIDWSSEGFDGSTRSTVTLTGTLRNGPHTELNVAGKTVSINVHMKDKLELKDIYTNVQSFTVFYNTSYEEVLAQLPSKLKVVEESGFEEELPVTWACDDYDPTKSDIYTFKCILPEDMLTNADEFDLEVEVRVLHEISRGSELLINPDFIDGTSAAPWKTGWGTGFFTVSRDPMYLLDGEPAVALVTEKGRYGSLQQDVTGQMKLMGDGKYLFQVYMRAYDSAEPIESSYACLQISSPSGTKVLGTRVESDIGIEWVRFYAVFNVNRVEEAREIMFHTSTGKTEDDSEKSFIIGGCSLIYLGSTNEEVEATLDSVGLVWNTIKGENDLQSNVMTDLTLPSATGEASTVEWSSSDESVITSDGEVTMGRIPKVVTMTATITYKNGVKTIKKFTVTVPRDPELPTFSGTLTGSQTVMQGDTFEVMISLKSDGAATFNAYRFTLSFNNSKMEYVGVSDPSSSVEIEGGKIEIFGIGTERPITDTITVTFRAKKAGLTEVKLVKMEMDLDPNASLDNLPTMTIDEGAALIDIQKIEDKMDDGTDSNKSDSYVIWIVIGLLAVMLITGGTIVLILLRKKKQMPSDEE